MPPIGRHLGVARSAVFSNRFRWPKRGRYFNLLVLLFLLALVFGINQTLIQYRSNPRQKLTSVIPDFKSLHNNHPIANKDRINHGNDSISPTLPHIVAGGSVDEKEEAFRQLLLLRASDDKLIVLASVDSGYVDMAINLYFTSLKKFDIDNYLFVGSDDSVCGILAGKGIACIEHVHDKSALKASSYGSMAFARKTHLKTKMIMEALLLKLKVLIVDLDIVFFKNPIGYMTCEDCDIEISSDIISENSGFYLVRPTTAGIKLHTDAWTKAKKTPKVSNQKVIHRILNAMTKAGTIRIQNLSRWAFLNGRDYFEAGKRMFIEDTNKNCTDCVMLHNNWMVSKEAKEYRFKEMGMWEVDANAYFSNTTRKYLSFDLPTDFGANTTRQQELNALLTAFIIGNILDRVVILPRFHCYGCDTHPNCARNSKARCTFGSLYKIRILDASFRWAYRESAFLEHHLVPDSVKNSLSHVYRLVSPSREQNHDTSAANIMDIYPKDQDKGITVEDIDQWLDDDVSVLRFHSLYLQVDVTKYDSLSVFLGSLKKALVKCRYRQY